MAGDSSQGLKRVLNRYDVAALTVGTMVGAGIFTVSGLALAKAGPSVIISVVIGAFVGLLTALAYAELSSAHPQAGGAYIFTRLAFTGRLAVIPFWVGALVLLELVVGGAVISSSWASYMAQALPVAPFILRFIPPVFVIAVALWGVKESSWVNILIVLMKLLALGVFAASALPLFSATRFVPFMPHGLGGMLLGSAIFFFAFVGFEVAAGVAGDAAEPEKTMPQGLLLGFAIVTVFYVLVMAGVVSSVSAAEVAGSGSPIAVAAARTLGATGAKILSLLVIFALLSTLLAGSTGASRIIYAMAKDGLLPSSFGRLTRRGVPALGFIVMTVTWFLLSQLAGIGALVTVLNFGTLAAFLFVNVALVVLRSRKDFQRGRFQVPLYPVTPIVGALSSLILIISLDRLTLWIGLAYSAVAMVYYYLMKKGETPGEIASRTAEN